MSNGSHDFEIRRQFEEGKRRALINCEGREYVVSLSNIQKDKKHLQCWSEQQVDTSWNLSHLFREFTNLVPISNIVTLL